MSTALLLGKLLGTNAHTAFRLPHAHRLFFRSQRLVSVLVSHTQGVSSDSDTSTLSLELNATQRTLSVFPIRRASIVSLLRGFHTRISSCGKAYATRVPSQQYPIHPNSESGMFPRHSSTRSTSSVSLFYVLRVTIMPSGHAVTALLRPPVVANAPQVA